MNRIGLPATGQQDNLSNCHDLYLFEARLVGGDEYSGAWFDCGFPAQPSTQAANTVAVLNRNDPTFVYRCRLAVVAEARQ